MQSLAATDIPMAGLFAALLVAPIAAPIVATFAALIVALFAAPIVAPFAAPIVARVVEGLSHRARLSTGVGRVEKLLS